MAVSRREFLRFLAASGVAAPLLSPAGILRVAAQTGTPTQQAPAAPSPTSGQSISLPTLPDGATLFYEIQGAGRPLLVMHGGPGLDHTYFHPWLDPLAQQFQLILPDMRGNGRSSAIPDDAYTYDGTVDDLDALRSALGIKQWAVLGHSFGGILAQVYALKYPSTISYLILADTTAAFLPDTDGMQLVADRITPEQQMILSSLGKLTSDQAWQQAWYTILPLYFHNFDVQSLIANDQTVYSYKALTQTGAHEAAPFDTRASLGQLNMPTMVGVGRYDFRLPVRDSEVIYKGIPGSELVVFPDSGHFPFIEDSGQFVDTVGQFLNGVPVGTGA